LPAAVLSMAGSLPGAWKSALLLDDGKDVFLAHDEQFFAIDLDGLSGILAKQHAVADLDVERTDLAAFEDLAVADCQDFALIRLLSRGFRENDAGRSFGFLVEALDDDAIVQRTKCHTNS
jgi:hypothetical protein